MNRFRLYIFAFLLNLIFFVVGLIFRFEDFVGVINLICFIVSVLFFLFTVEEPPAVEKLKIPEVHNYYRERQNNYSNYVALEFTLLSFVFFSLSTTPLNVGWIVNGLWLLSIPITFFIIYITSRNREIFKVIDYIKFVEPVISENQIKGMVQKFIELNTLDKDVLLSLKGYNSTLLLKVVNAYIHYQSNKNNNLTKEEIEEINSL